MNGFNISNLNFWNPISALIDWINGIIGDIGAYIVAMFYKLLFALWSSVANILDSIQILFQMFAGTVPVVYKSNSLFANSGNLIMDIIMHPFIYEAFMRILMLSFFLLIIFTFIAVVKSEASTETAKSGNGKSAIIGKSLRAFGSFFFIPMVCIFGIIASGYLMQALDYATSPNSSTLISNKLFLTSAYSCNRARSDEGFFKAMTDVEHKYDGYNVNNYLFTGFTDREKMAEAIDDAFDQCKTIEDISKKYGGAVEGQVVVRTNMSTGDRFANYIDSCLLGTDNGITKDTYFNCKNASMVFYFYDLAQFNWIVAIFSIFFLAEILVSITLGAAVRLYELAILFVISPAVISMMPLDDGPFKTWKKKFIGKVTMVFAPVVGLNLYFILLNTLLQVDMMATIQSAVNSGLSFVLPVGLVALLAAGGVGAILLANIFDLFIILAGAMVCKETIKWLGEMIGAEDIQGTSDRLKKNVSEFVKTNAAMAVGIGAGKFAAGKLKDVSANKMQAMSEKRQNKKTGAGQLAASEQVERNQVQDAMSSTDRMLGRMDDKYGNMTTDEKNTKIAENLQEATDFAKANGMKMDEFNALSDEYNASYQSNLAHGMTHEEANAAAFNSLDKSKYGNVDADGLKRNLRNMNNNRIMSLSRSNRVDALNKRKERMIDKAHVEAKDRRKAILDGKGEDPLLQDTNKVINDAVAAVAEAAKENAVDMETAKREFSEGKISAEEFDARMKEIEANKYGGQDKDLIKAIEKSDKSSKSYKKKKEFEEEFKKSIKDAVDKANKGKGGYNGGGGQI